MPEVEPMEFCRRVKVSGGSWRSADGLPEGTRLTPEADSEKPVPSFFADVTGLAGAVDGEAAAG